MAPTACSFVGLGARSMAAADGEKIASDSVYTMLWPEVRLFGWANGSKRAGLSRCAMMRVSLR